MRRILRRGAREESGFTLVEVLLAGTLGSVVLGIAGTLLLSGLRAQHSVVSMQDVTQTMTVIDGSLTAAVRNASAVAVGGTAVPAGDQFAEVLTSRYSVGGASSGQRYVAWYFDAAKGALYTRTSTHSAGAIAVPSAGDRAYWQLLGVGVSRLDGTQPVFACFASGGLSVAMRIAGGSAAAQSYATAIAPQVSSGGGIGVSGMSSCAG